MCPRRQLPRRGATVTPRGSDGTLVPAKGTDGDGFACCGVFKYFLVPTLPSHLSLRAELSVSRGVARALFLKAGSCPRFPEDVVDDACTGQCAVEWVTTFNPYDGTPVSKGGADLTVPNGLGAGCPAACPPDLRAGGDWYIGVQALHGTEAEFTLTTSLVEPPPLERGHQCDPSAPECRGPTFVQTYSSAHSVRWRRGANGLSMALGLTLATSINLLVFTRRRSCVRQRWHQTLSTAS